MSTTGSCHSGAANGRPRHRTWLSTFTLAILLASPLASLSAQETAAQETATDGAKAAGPTAAAPADATPATPPATSESATTDAVPAELPETTQSPATTDAPATTDDTKVGDVTTATDAAAAPADATAGAAVSTDSASTDSVSRPLMYGAIIIALFVLPVIVGNMLANWLRMPDYGWKISLVLGTLAASIVIVSLGEFKFGPDLAGGITLIYELKEQPAAAADGAAPAGPNIKMQELIDILKRRIDPTGTREVTIREYGQAIEIIIPNTGQDALEFVKRRITEMGQLEFRITADPSQPNPQEREIIRLALALSPAQKEVSLGGRVVAEWVAYSLDEFGPADQEDPNGRNIVKRQVGDTPEALVLIDPESVSVTGDYLRTVSKGVDERGGPAVNFTFDTQGARRFQQLTSKNLPNQATNTRRYLGIVLDKRLLSAPSIESTIYSSGQISGRNMREQEVDYVVSILQEGKLPLELAKEPISEQIISPTLGAETVVSGERAILV